MAKMVNKFPFSRILSMKCSTAIFLLLFSIQLFDINNTNLFDFFHSFLIKRFIIITLHGILNELLDQIVFEYRLVNRAIKVGLCLCLGRNKFQAILFEQAATH